MASGRSDGERRLARYFDAAGAFVQRSPSSGGGVGTGDLGASGPGEGRCQPDLVVADHGTVLLIEAKEGQAPHYIDAEEVAALQWVQNHLPARVVLASRFRREAFFRLAYPSQLSQTDAGSYKFAKDSPYVVALTDPRSDAADPGGVGHDVMAEEGLKRILDSDDFKP